MNNGKKKIFTIFGGTGDLTYRKLIPAFYNLRALDKLSEDFELVIIGRREYTKDAYMELVRPWVTQFSRLPFKEETFNELTSHITYLQMDFMKLDQYEILNKFYNKFPSNQQRLYYLAVAPEFFSVISNHLKEAKMVENDHIHQVMIEKPFGHNIESAMALHEDLAKAFGSDDIYRIDHYLGKEMIQNILSIRFNNALFEGIWNYEQIDNIQISALETVGVENRGNYYDHTGALKDMVQNHLFQVLSIVAMDKPKSFSAEDIQSEQVKVLDSLRFLSEDEVSSHMVLGQYGGGYLSDHCVRAYREE
ncbi:MAG TPA: glucose-6-phosphate dehydrogenase, partial [Erysipelotrichaceae bacterium]|nr:glucose-6-phosphate dehydrogenase [Erysipelotrichaceae bacterium]